KKNSKKGNADIDWCLYKYQHLVENTFAQLKHFRSIVSLFDHLAANGKDQQYLISRILIY
ncbi:MAG: IS5-like element ISSoc13 family transposase, partial [Marinomonadaceae bacterium]